MFESQIVNGVALLNEHFDLTWPNKIDINLLDMNDCFNCVLGQLFGEFYKGLYDLNIKVDINLRYDCGFALPLCFEAGNRYSKLNDEWKTTIINLRGFK